MIKQTKYLNPFQVNCITFSEPEHYENEMSPPEVTVMPLCEQFAFRVKYFFFFGRFSSDKKWKKFQNEHKCKTFKCRPPTVQHFSTVLCASLGIFLVFFFWKTNWENRMIRVSDTDTERQKKESQKGVAMDTHGIFLALSWIKHLLWIVLLISLLANSKPISLPGTFVHAQWQ